MKRLISTLPFLFAIFVVFAQEIPVGGWRTHQTYHDTQVVEKAGNKIYAASSNGLFYVDTEDNSVNLFTTLDGLSDTGIADMIYHPLLDRLLIIYRNGNLDVVEEDEIINVRTILNADVPDKEIHTAIREGNLIYMATSFGVVVFDLSTLKVKETYGNIGEGGERVSVTDLAIHNDSLFITTSQSLLFPRVGKLSPEINLLDFQNWSDFKPINSVNKDTVSQIIQLEGFPEGLFFSSRLSGIYRYQDGFCKKLELTNGVDRTINGLFKVTVNGLYSDFSRNILSGNTSLDVHNLDGELIANYNNSYFSIPADIYSETANEFWLADASQGLIYYDGNQKETYFPTGPFSQNVQRLEFLEGKIVAVSGSVDKAGNGTGSKNGYYTFQNGEWSNYTPQQNFIGATQTPEVEDLIDVAYQFSTDKYFFASFGNGLLSWSPADNSFELLSEAPLVSSEEGTFISGVDTDFDDRVWVANYGVAAGQPSVHILDREGNWSSLTFNRPEGREILQLLIDDFQQGWAIVAESGGSGKGIFVFDDAGNERMLVAQPGSGDLPTNSVNCLVKDRTGSIWVGTDGGVTEFFDPARILTTSATDAAPPRFENRPLLEGIQVNAIAVDGGNRKWIGTNGGAWLFSANGSELIHHFTTENSPLLSDVIKTIAIQPETGEVFFGTEAGIISYRSDATDATFAHQNVKIFPNPVTPRYEGVVTVSGLTRDGNVKITDISGKKIREVRANGGTATWDVMDYNGRKAKSGVYLVFSSSSDGEETFVGRLAVIE